jgi:hypothetical protein
MARICHNIIRNSIVVTGQHFREILETLLTPDEAGIILELFAPLTPAELAVKMNTDAISLAARIGNLAQRGLLYREKDQYVAWGDAHQLKARVAFSAHENIPPKYIELRKKDMRYEESPDGSEVPFIFGTLGSALGLESPMRRIDRSLRLCRSIGPTSQKRVTQTARTCRRGLHSILKRGATLASVSLSDALPANTLLPRSRGVR